MRSKVDFPRERQTSRVTSRHASLGDGHMSRSDPSAIVLVQPGNFVNPIISQQKGTLPQSSALKPLFKYHLLFFLFVILVLIIHIQTKTRP